MFAPMNDELKEIIDKRIKMLGLKKAYLASRMGLDPVRYSQTMSGKRKIQPNELKALKEALDL